LFVGKEFFPALKAQRQSFFVFKNSDWRGTIHEQLFYLFPIHKIHSFHESDPSDRWELSAAE
jgi:hypothetical protein